MSSMNYMAVSLIVNGCYYREDVTAEELEMTLIPVDDEEEAEALIYLLYGRP